jgi:hypothetical protein
MCIGRRKRDRLHRFGNRVPATGAAERLDDVGIGHRFTDHGDENAEHLNKYGLPSDAHFEEDDEFLHDPHNREFFVAPDVIGGPE